MSRNICILTQPLRNNYGCVLQAYALQLILKRKGYNVVTDESQYKRLPFKRLVIGRFNSIIFNILSGKFNFNFFHKDIPISYYLKANEKFRLFIKENIDTIEFFGNRRRPSKIMINKFDTFIVGSDQVWRPKFSNIYAYLLDFCKDYSVKKIAYAASFGIETDIEFSPVIKVSTKKLATRFNAISVREDSGISLCKSLWDIDAQLVLDPTLLLKKKDYISLVEKDSENLYPSKGSLFMYILDKNERAESISNIVSNKLHLRPYEIMPREKLTKQNLNNPEAYRFERVTQWLKSFIDAKFVITDSFHGMVFSIIFNKPFLVLPNKNRGLTRFTSLLNMLSLQNRLIVGDNLSYDILEKEIDYSSVNNNLEILRESSIDFLFKNLK